MAVEDFKELIAWQKAIDFVVEVDRVTNGFPADERFGLTTQLRRAAVSVPSNIAEGQSRGPCQDFVRFLTIARGSLQEVVTQLTVALRLEYLSGSEFERLAADSEELARLIRGLARSIPVR